MGLRRLSIVVLLRVSAARRVWSRDSCVPVPGRHPGDGDSVFVRADHLGRRRVCDVELWHEERRLEPYYWQCFCGNAGGVFGWDIVSAEEGVREGERSPTTSATFVFGPMLRRQYSSFAIQRLCLGYNSQYSRVTSILRSPRPQAEARNAYKFSALVCPAAQRTRFALL